MKPTKLTLPLFRKLHRRIFRNHAGRGDGSPIAVGLGWALKGGRPDPARPGNSLVFAVRKKIDPTDLPEDHRIKHLEPAALPSKSKRKRLAHFQTDVIELGDGYLTGFQGTTGGERFTVGALVSWQTDDGINGGFVTVAHGLPSPANNAIVAVAIGEQTFNARVVRRTSPASWLDAALLQLSPDDIQDGPLAPFFTRNTAVKTNHLADLIAEANVTHPRGFSFTTSGLRPFVYSAYFPIQDPSNPILRNAPQLCELLIARGSINEFEPGTSGSPWAGTQTVADALQVGGYTGQDQDGNLLPFYKGIAQPLEESMNWAAQFAGPSLKILAVL